MDFKISIINILIAVIGVVISIIVAIRNSKNAQKQINENNKNVEKQIQENRKNIEMQIEANDTYMKKQLEIQQKQYELQIEQLLKQENANKEIKVINDKGEILRTIRVNELSGYSNVGNYDIGNCQVSGFKLNLTDNSSLSIKVLTDNASSYFEDIKNGNIDKIYFIVPISFCIA